MKTLNYICGALMLAFFTAACSTPVHVERDAAVNMNNYKTYMWVELRNAGWREVTDNPDILVSYDVLVQNTTARRSDPVYSESYSRYYYNPRLKRWGTIYYPSQFLGYDNYQVPVNEGTITITLTDANTDKVVWQGWTSEELNYSRITQDEISAGVKNIFRKLDLAAR